MKAKFILFANLKGGVGKSTLAAMFAHYLLSKNKPVAVVDADIQQSLSWKRDKDLRQCPDSPVPWPILSMDTSSLDNTKAMVNQLKTVKGNIVFDMPGTFNDPNLAPIIQMADVIIIPMAYDDLTIKATEIFVNVVRQLTKAQLIFVPNRINITIGKKAELEQRELVVKQLESVGHVTPRIKQGASIMRMSTLGVLDKFQELAVQYAFSDILSRI